MASTVFQRNAFQNRAETNFKSEEKYHAFQIFEEAVKSAASRVGRRRDFRGRHADRGR